MSGGRFGKQFHLRRRKEFEAVYAHRLRVQDGLLILCGAENRLGYARLGLSVSRKVGNAAVRNLWKRRIREAFRLQRGALPTTFDLVVIPQRGAALPTFGALERSLLLLAQKLEKKAMKKSQTAPESKCGKE